MRELRSISKSTDITWKEFAEGTHNETILEPGFFDAISKFLDRISRGAFHDLTSISQSKKGEDKEGEEST